ncbi:MAG: proteasome-activating nucleotidase [Thermoplasmata archaeon]|nr:MAG: proteasome-activating nucleotidase [Thermoplasmata archaeon]
MDEDELKETTDNLLERVAALEHQNSELAKDTKKIENEKRYLESELTHLQSEVKRLKAELERMKAPPLIIGSIRGVLENGKVVVKSTTGPTFIVNSAGHISKESLIVGSQVALNKQTLSIMDVLPPSKDPLVIGAEIIEKPGVTYGDIGGLEEQLREIREAVEEPMIKPELYIKVGIEPPKGVLLVGPPGVGKTLLAKAVAQKTNATFIRFVGSELVQKYIGEGARLVRELFALAKEKSPTIVFIDELDSIGAKRLEIATSGDREVQRTLMQLLAELDGFDPIGDVKLIAATNRPDILDEALLRPGRFDRIIKIPVPNLEARIEIFKIHTKRMNLAKDVDVEIVAAKCEGNTGAEIKSICTEAGMFAIREGRDMVEMADFEKALDKVRGGELLRAQESGVMFA